MKTLRHIVALTITSLIWALTTVITVAQPAAAATNLIAVNSTADVVDANPGTTSLREAINEANSDGMDTVIALATTTYSLNLGCGMPGEDANAGGDLDVTGVDSLTIEGANATVDQTCAGERVLHQQNAGTWTPVRCSPTAPSTATPEPVVVPRWGSPALRHGRATC